MAEFYDYIIDPSTGIREFVTTHGVSIKIIITKDRSWFPYNPEFKDIYSFDLIAKPASKIPDVKIRNTIRRILEERFENKDTVIIYYCDNEDGKELKRSKKFERWYRAMDSTIIHKFDRHVTYHDEDIYTSLLIHEENSRYKQIVRVYEAGENDVSDKFDI